MSFTDIVASDKAGSSDTAYEVTAVGNEYNVIIPAEGQTEMMYLPDGKYEITCHEDIDFHSISFIDSDNGSKTTSLEEDNGRWFITFSSTSNENKNSVNEFLDSKRTNTSNVTGNSEIDWWRGYDDDAANIAFDKVTGREIDQTFNNNVMRNGSSTYGVDSINPFTATHGPTAKVKGYDNLNYNKYNNVTKNSGASQYNGFQVNTWRDRSVDKLKQPLQYNKYVLNYTPNTKSNEDKPYGQEDKNKFSIPHNYDAFYIGSHSWAEIRENLINGETPEEGQEPNGIGSSDGNHLYKGTPGTNSTRPKVTGPNLPYGKADNWTETSGNRFNYTGIIENWKSSTAQSNTNGTYTKPATK